MLDVVALGELLIDFAPVSTDAAGYPTLAAQPGGAPGNFLAALQTYGCTTALIGKVGADRFGELLKATLAEKGIGTRGIVADPAVFTTLAFVTLDATGNREFSFARKPGADTCLTPEEVDIALHLTYASGWDWDAVKSYVEAVIDAYFVELSQDWASSDFLTVRISQIESRILSECSNMITDIGGTKINGQENNLALGPDSIPARGEVTDG